MNSLPSYLAGVATTGDRWIDVFNPWNNEPVGRVACISGEQLDAAIRTHLMPHDALTRHERSRILNKTRDLLDARREELAKLITAEAGLCLRETRYEVGRACDVFAFAAMEALRGSSRANNLCFVAEPFEELLAHDARYARQSVQAFLQNE